VAARAGRFLSRIQNSPGDVLVFSSGHFIRMLAACWLKLPPVAGRCLACSPASIGVLAFDHNRVEEPVINLWNAVAAGTGETALNLCS
jgi:probable phosphoglycerate mutase